MSRHALKFIAGILLPLLLLPGPAGRAGAARESIQGREATVVFDPPLEGLAREILSAYPGIRADLEADLRWEIRFHAIIALVPDRESFQAITGKDLVVALAVPGRNLIVLDGSRVGSHPRTMDSVLKHEMCHLLLHSRIPDERLPLWLNEGVAQWVSGGISEISLPRRASVLDEAVLSKRLIPIESLSRGFFRDGKVMLLAYEQSNSLVRFIIGRYGKEGLLGILNRLSRGDSLDAALAGGISLSLTGLEEAWKKDLKEKVAWSSFVLGYLYEIIFFVASLGIVIGFIRQRVRRKREMATMDEAEDDL